MPARSQLNDRLAWKLLVLLCALLLGLGLGEIALRIAWHNPYAREAPDHLIKLRIQHPNTDSWIRGTDFEASDSRTRFRTDDRSYIEPAFVHASPRFTVAFLGGSTTACNAVSEDLRFPSLVGALLSQRGIATNGLNAGRSGSTLHDSLNVLLNHVLNDRPDVVVMMHATNDIGVLAKAAGYEARSGSPVSVPELGKWVMQMLSRRLYVAGLVRRVSTYSPQTTAVDRMKIRNSPENPRVDPAQFEARLRTFVQLCHAFGIVPVLMTQPLSNSLNALAPKWADRANQDVFNEVVRQVAHSEDVMLIDLVRHLHEDIADWQAPMNVFYDGMHVTDYGSRVYAEHITERLLPLAQQIANRRENESRHAGLDAAAAPAPR